MKDLPRSPGYYHAVATAAVAPLVQCLAFLEELFPEYPENDREAFDALRIMITIFSRYGRDGGFDATEAKADIEHGLRLSRGSVEGRLKRLRKHRLITSIKSPENGRKRLTVPTQEAIDRFLKLGLLTASAIRTYDVHLKKLCPDLPDIEPEDGFYDPFPKGLKVDLGQVARKS